MQIQELILLYRLELERASRHDATAPFGRTLEEYKVELKRELKELKKLDARCRRVVEG